MSVYFIANYDIKDAEAHNDYVIAAGPLVKKHGGKLLAAEEDAKIVEGGSKMMNVIVQFDSETAAMNFYNDPEYTPAKKIRQEATENVSMILTRDMN